MQARPGPECSSSMPSWSMVSSRCVSGLSTGIRPVSAGIKTNIANKASKSGADQAASAWGRAASPPSVSALGYFARIFSTASRPFRFPMK